MSLKKFKDKMINILFCMLILSSSTNNKFNFYFILSFIFKVCFYFLFHEFRFGLKKNEFLNI